MDQHCCPWWMNYIIGSPLRRLLQPPGKLFGDLVKPSMTVLDAGCGMGVYTFALAQMVGPEGFVVAVDVEQKNLNVLNRKAKRKGMDQRIKTIACDLGELPQDDKFNFALAANSVHEVPENHRFLEKLSSAMDSDAKFLMIEPSGHLSEQDFQQELELAKEVGFQVLEQSKAMASRIALLAKQ